MVRVFIIATLFKFLWLPQACAQSALGIRAFLHYRNLVYIAQNPDKTEQELIKNGLVNAAKHINNLHIDIRYSSTNNFLYKDVYGSFCKCYLQPEVVNRLNKASAMLDSISPGTHFLALDCARPLSVQQKMWDALDMPAAEKGKYVSNPANHSVHNYGAAIDITLCDENGQELDMGTPYDFFGPEAYPYAENDMISKGKLSAEQVERRRLLRKVLESQGFRNVAHEWWHFNLYTREVAKKKFKVIY